MALIHEKFMKKLTISILIDLMCVLRYGIDLKRFNLFHIFKKYDFNSIGKITFYESNMLMVKCTEW